MRVPSDRRLRRLEVRSQTRVGPTRPDTYRVARHTRKDPDWTSLGFTVVAHLRPRTEDTEVVAWSHTAWTGLVEMINQERRP